LGLQASVIVSPRLSNEELYLSRKIFGELMGLDQIGYRSPCEKQGLQDDFLVRADKNPNSRGAEEMGLNRNVNDILEKVASGEIKVLYVFGHDFDSPDAQQMLKQAEYIIFQGSHWNKTADLAHLILPAAVSAEKDGTFTNFEGRVQHFRQAFLPLADSRADHEILIQVAQELEYPLVYLTAEDLFMEWFGKAYEELDEFGEMLGEKQ
jgi:NADH-quinone oxidoreductase subunit G